MCNQRMQTHYLLLLSAWKYVCVHRLTLEMLNSTLWQRYVSYSTNSTGCTKRSQSDCDIFD